MQILDTNLLLSNHTLDHAYAYDISINDLYDIGFKNGASGGKLVGAGGGGFLMFYANDKIKLRNVMKSNGLTEVRFKFDYDGTKVVLRS